MIEQRRAREFICALLVSALSMVPSWSLIAQRSATPFDEAAHFDFVDKIAFGRIPEVNEAYGQKTLWLQACLARPSAAWAPIGECRDQTLFDPNLAPFNGQSSATGYSPTFYLVSAVIYRVFFEIDDFLKTPLNTLDIARLANSMWGFVTAFMVYTVSRRLRMKVTLSIALTTTVTSAPAMALQLANVNSDAGGLFAVTASLAFAVFAIERFQDRVWTRRRASWMLIGVVSLLCTIKETVLISVPGIVALVLVVTHFDRGVHVVGRGTLVRGLSAFAAISISIVVSSIGFRVVQPLLRGRAGEDWMSILLPTIMLIDNPYVIAIQIPKEAFSAFSNVTWPTLTDVSGQLSTMFIGLLPFVFLVGAVGVWKRRRFDDSDPGLHQAFAIGYTVNFVALPLGAIGMGVASMIFTDIAISQPRYYMAASSALILMGTWACRQDFGKFAAGVLLAPWLLTVFAIAT